MNPILIAMWMNWWRAFNAIATPCTAATTHNRPKANP